MSLFNMMAREQKRIDAELAACVATPQSSRLKGADLRAALDVANYLRAQRRTMYPALIAVDVDGAEEPVLRHHRLKVCTRLAVAACRSGDARAVEQTLGVLLRQWRAQGEYEQGRLRALFEQRFSVEELRQLAGEMLLELRGPDSPSSDGRLRMAIRGWWWRLRQRATGSRVVPTLREAVFAYRGN